MSVPRDLQCLAVDMSNMEVHHPLNTFILETEHIFRSLFDDANSTQLLDGQLNNIDGGKHSDNQTPNLSHSNLLALQCASALLPVNDGSSLYISELFDRYSTDHALVSTRPRRPMCVINKECLPDSSAMASETDLNTSGSSEAQTSSFSGYDDTNSSSDNKPTITPKDVTFLERQVLVGSGNTELICAASPEATSTAERPNLPDQAADIERQAGLIDANRTCSVVTGTEDIIESCLNMPEPQIMIPPPPVPPKGRSKWRHPLMKPSSKTRAAPSSSLVDCEAPVTPLPRANCGICFDPFFVVDNPGTYFSSDQSKHIKRIGMLLPCAGEHSYCAQCLNEYIKIALKKGKKGKSVFPIACPECPTETWKMTTEVVEKFLSSELLDSWHRQERLELMEQIDCPYEDCTASFEVTKTFEEPRSATCPDCTRSICLSCKTPPHPALTCDENMADNTDGAIYDMARNMGWKRCQICRMVVERTSGCSHMTCLCGYEFCYRCGSRYLPSGCIQGGMCSSVVDLTLAEPTPPISAPKRLYRRAFGWLRQVSRIWGRR